MAMTALEQELTAITREFVARIVGAIRAASFADVASLSASARESPPTPSRARKAPANGAPAPRTRQSAAGLAELSARVLQVLSRAGEPMGVRALSAELKVAPDRLTVPLKQLRTSGKVTKH